MRKGLIIGGLAISLAALFGSTNAYAESVSVQIDDSTLYSALKTCVADGITKEEFVKNADDSDMTIIRLLASIKKMLSLGASPKDVEKFVKQNIIAEAKQSFQSN